MAFGALSAQKPPGQSPGIVQGRPAFAPPTQAAATSGQLSRMFS
jgi:hypothetical protein